ncbi:hypothetical protein PPYR_14604 [Photinus pyralis]|uniref:Vacuolar protein sorting-associated protein 33B n=1 Tax=Photinus pyralis TaxID=7054 RepID=A0A1Y1KUW7_PHOPY|nr:vacuolar protein sorting-associated protein 33B [Photinus pyralis]KAB0792645.1 hypothetical protein PPYR_14604 [Photinus pyralis]
MIYKKLSSLSEISKAQISKILNSCSGLKDLVLDPKIIKPLERICGIRWLKANYVEKIFKLEDNIPNSSNPQFYFIYTSLSTLKKLLQQIRLRLKNDATVADMYHIVIIPRFLYVFENMLEEMGLFGVVKLYSLQWQPLHLDRGILSLEIPNLYRRLFVQHDLSLLPIYAKSLWHLYFVIGKPRFHFALGAHSISVLKQLDTLYENLPNTDKVEADCGAVIMLDRNVDYVSALLTPSTYTALLNEVYGINCGVCEHKSTGTPEHDQKFNRIPKKEPIQIILDSTNDSIYRDIKNRYFPEVTSILRTLTRDLRKEGENSRGMALDEIKKYVSTQLQATASKMKYLANHLEAAQTIINHLGHRFEMQQDTEQLLIQNKGKSSNLAYLEEVLVTENNRNAALRLLCLMAITQKLSDSEVKSFWQKFLHEFGYYYGFVHNNLLRAGFLTEETSASANLPNIVSKFLTNDFYVNINRLKQAPVDPAKVSLKAPTCCSYVFGGAYIPLIVQIASMILCNTPLNEIKTKLEPLGPFSIRNEQGYPLEARTILIYIVGGVTYSEIAACNLLETLTGSTIIVCSDKIISGNDLMEALTTV